MEEKNVARRVNNQVLMGVLVIAAGLLFLLDNLHVIELHEAISFWPLLFIGVGLVKAFDTASPNRLLVGGVFIGLGVLIILRRMDVINVNPRVLWPVLLIAAGAVLVARAFRARATPPGGTNMLGLVEHGESADDVVNVMAVMGGFERRVTNQHFRGGEITSIMAGCVLDLRDASIDREAVLNVFAFWGGITLKCPPDWTVVMDGTPILGGFEEKTARAPHQSKRLVVRGYAIMGGVEVRN